ncbi:MAG: type III pantothenate kinase, partial [Acidimicrobiales bacterium]
MLLAIDVGNTQIVVGLFADSDGVGTGDLVHHWRVATHPQYTADEFALQLFQLLALDGVQLSSVTGTVVACVVPPVQAALRQMTGRRLGVPTVIVEPGVRTGMPVLVDNPKEVGADRIADAVAAFERYGGPTIVVDFGTATNFEVISAKGEYLG